MGEYRYFPNEINKSKEEEKEKEKQQEEEGFDIPFDTDCIYRKGPTENKKVKTNKS